MFFIVVLVVYGRVVGMGMTALLLSQHPLHSSFSAHSIYVLYKSIIYFSIFYFLSALIQKKGKGPGASQANRPSRRQANRPSSAEPQPTSRPPDAAQRATRADPVPIGRPIALPLSRSPSLSLTAGPTLIPNPSLTKPNQSTPERHRGFDLPAIALRSCPLLQVDIL